MTGGPIPEAIVDIVHGELHGPPWVHPWWRRDCCLPIAVLVHEQRRSRLSEDDQRHVGECRYCQRTIALSWRVDHPLEDQMKKQLVQYVLDPRGSAGRYAISFHLEEDECEICWGIVDTAKFGRDVRTLAREQRLSGRGIGPPHGDPEEARLRHLEDKGASLLLQAQGRLSGLRRLLLSYHLRNCETCRSELATLRRVVHRPPEAARSTLWVARLAARKQVVREDLEELARQLAKARRASPLTLDQLAARAGVPLRVLADFERDPRITRSISALDLARLAKVLRLDLSLLLGHVHCEEECVDMELAELVTAPDVRRLGLAFKGFEPSVFESKKEALRVIRAARQAKRR